MSEKPRVFIGSSIEVLDVVKAFQVALGQHLDVKIWHQGIFLLTSSALLSLVRMLENFDYAIFVCSPDELNMVRASVTKNVRDNMIFELGLYMGKLGANRISIVIPEESRNVRLPFDLLGVTANIYPDLKVGKDLQQGIMTAADEILRRIQQLQVEQGKTSLTGDAWNNECNGGTASDSSTASMKVTKPAKVPAEQMVVDLMILINQMAPNPTSHSLIHGKMERLGYSPADFKLGISALLNKGLVSRYDMKKDDNESLLITYRLSESGTDFLLGLKDTPVYKGSRAHGS